MIVIDPSAAPELFRRIRMKPALHATYEPGCGACDIVMAHYIDKIGRTPGFSMPDQSLAKLLGWSPWYVTGLMYGWDGYSAIDVAIGGTMDWSAIRLGLEHGREAMYCCFAAGLIPQLDYLLPESAVA